MFASGSDKMLEIKNLYASVDGRQVLKGITLTIKDGEVHALMGPNGTGKSTLAMLLAGHPKYRLDSGEILFNGQKILEMKPEERAAAGFFLVFQHPLEIPGVNLGQFLFSIYRKKNPKASPLAFKKILNECIAKLNLNNDFADKQLNAGLSGGEKKRAEVLQLLLLQPSLAVLDEADSGLDIDSLKTIASAIEQLRSPSFSAVVITHYNRVLQHLKPDFVHVLVDGAIVLSGDSTLPSQLEQKGYNWLSAEAEA